MRKSRLTVAILGSLLLSSGAGCAWLSDVSSSMRVDTGLNPENIDDNVRFRTTYYFRVLTGCRIDEPDPNEHVKEEKPKLMKRTSGHFSPLNDSLYRFRMTGQAAALFNRIHFESGVLRKQQIDPFGSAVRYNEQTNSFIPVSAEELRADARIDSAKRDIEEFRALYKRLKEADQQQIPVADQDVLLRKLIQIMEERLEFIRQSFQPNALPSPAAPRFAANDKGEKDLSKLTTQLDELSGTLNKEKASLQAATTNLQKVQEEVDRITQQIAEARKKLEDTTDKSADLKKKIDELSKQLVAANEKLVKAKADSEKVQSQIAQLNTSIEATKTKIKAADDDVSIARLNTLTPLKDLYAKTEALLAELGALEKASTPAKTGNCNGKPTLNKYYLMGPEGTKELDPDDRLLLALSVDSKPLISALQKFSEHRSQSSEDAMKAMEQVMAERGRILDARELLRSAGEDAGKESGAMDQSKIENLVHALRTLYSVKTSTKP